MILVTPVCERNKKPRICNRFQMELYPFREDKSGAPSIQPIKYANGFLESDVFIGLAASDPLARFFKRTLALTDIFRGFLTSVAGIAFL